LVISQGVDIKTNVRKEANVYDEDISGFLELDVYLPSLNLAFEFHVCHFPLKRSVCILISFFLIKIINRRSIITSQQISCSSH